MLFFHHYYFVSELFLNFRGYFRIIIFNFILEFFKFFVILEKVFAFKVPIKAFPHFSQIFGVFSHRFHIIVKIIISGSWYFWASLNFQFIYQFRSYEDFLRFRRVYQISITISIFSSILNFFQLNFISDMV